MDDSELRAQLEQHHRASYGWALNCAGRDRQLAEDVLQSSYLKVLQAKAPYMGLSEFKTWLFAIIRKTAADEQRRLALRRLLLLRNEGRVTPPAASEQPDRRAERAESDRRFERALASLPGRQRQVLYLVFAEDLSLQQAAGVMGISVGAVRRHYERGKQRLREQFNRSEF
jgi:RNA polymerase sigma-70 factor, ECF subfamily